MHSDLRMQSPSRPDIAYVWLPVRDVALHDISLGYPSTRFANYTCRKGHSLQLDDQGGKWLLDVPDDPSGNKHRIAQGQRGAYQGGNQRFAWASMAACESSERSLPDSCGGVRFLALCRTASCSTKSTALLPDGVYLGGNLAGYPVRVSFLP